MGIFTAIDGSVFEGKWHKNYQHGEGILRYEDGREVRGIWEHGTLLT